MAVYYNNIWQSKNFPFVGRAQFSSGSFLIPIDSSPRNYSMRTAPSTTSFSFSMINWRPIRLYLRNRDSPSMQGHGSSTYCPLTSRWLPPSPTFCSGTAMTSAVRGVGQIKTLSGACGQSSTGESGMLMERERCLLTMIWTLITERCSRFFLFASRGLQARSYSPPPHPPVSRRPKQLVWCHSSICIYHRNGYHLQNRLNSSMVSIR